MTIHSGGGHLVLALTATLLALASPGQALGAFGQQVQDRNSQSSRTDQSSSASASSQTAVQASAPPPSAAQASNPSTPTTNQQKLQCSNAANPNLRRFGCKDEQHDWDATLTRGWDGLRDKIRNLGIIPSGSYYSALQTNVTGGPHQIWGYVGVLTTALDFNLQKLLKIPGMSLYFSDLWGTGSNLTASLGSVFPVNPEYAVGAHLGEIYLQEKFLRGNLTVAAGRLGADYTFASLPVFNNYVSGAINSTPESLVANDLSFTGPPPGLEWGAQAIYNVTSSVQLAAGVFNTNANSANNGNVFVLQQANKGALVSAQLSYLYNQNSNDKGMPGQYTAGFFEDNSTFATLPLGNRSSNGNSGIFILGQQMVYGPGGPGTAEGLTVWAAGTYSSKQLVSSMPVFGGAGLSYEGLIKQRKKDITSVAWIYGKTSTFIPFATAAKMLEANYQWAPTRYITVIPDFQYIWRPTGTNGPGSAVLGAQINVTF
jgi:carbohydrate-selective porin OprB